MRKVIFSLQSLVRRYVVSIVFAFVLIAVYFVCLANVAQARTLPDSFANLVERLTPSVVNISTSQTIDGKNPFEDFNFQFPPGSPFEDLPELFEFFGNRGGNGGALSRKAISLGSGFVIDESGLIATNYHVIEKAEEITVTFSDETTAEAKVIGRDPKTDLAILQVKVDKKISAVKFGDSDDVRVGDWAIAIGNPFGLGGSVSAGIISARARDINSGPFDDFLQTDAAINRGNSGGPLFNIKGEVIGINSAIFSPSGGNVGIGFAIPSNMAGNVIMQLRESGKIIRGWLGVKIQTVTEEIAESIGLGKVHGALVVEVTKDSPADKAGVKAGDIITSFDGHEVASMRKLPRMVAETNVNKTVKMEVFRQGKFKKFDVVIGELKDDQAKRAFPANRGDNDVQIDEGEELLGMSLKALEDDLRNRYGIDNKVHGLIVLDVKRESEALRKGIRTADVIVAANQRNVSSFVELKKIVDEAKANNRKSILLLIDRDGDAQFVALPLEQ